jgi:two-component system chemotaxis sensor kinase CheA
MDELLADFLTETAENLQTVDSQLVRFEREPQNRDVLNDIFRLVHTIKGTCGFLNLPRLEALAHAAETVLGKVRDGHAELNPQAISETLAAIDSIKAMLAALEADGKEPAGNDAAQIARLLATIDREAGAAEPQLLVESDAAVGVSAEFPTSSIARQSIRVSVDLLEQLITSVSELVLTRNELLQHLREAKDERFAAPLQRLSGQVGELQECVMRTRMQPIGGAWTTLPRLVRSLSAELGKPIELVTAGETTELDRQLLELIKDPLSHMVRNAADHGIESPDVRKAAGKPRTGRISLSASQEGGHIVVRLADDGAGIDTERLRQKAVERRILSEEEARALTAQQALRLIFHAGLSTAERVTAVSGRGVGMDVVKANIERIAGQVDVESVRGKGSLFTIRIPLTLAIMPVLVVASGNQRFAIPQMSVVELVRLGRNSENRTEILNGTKVLRLRERLLPIVDLDDMLGIGDGSGGRYVLVSKAGNLSFGLVVDKIFDTEEIVVKPVAPILKPLTLYSGNAILGDGQVIMILDMNGVADRVGDLAQTENDLAAETIEPAAGQATDSMLVFAAGSGAPKAVPLSLVARIEDFDVSSIEFTEGQPVVQYRDGLMPLVPVDGLAKLPESGSQAVLVFSSGSRSIGLLVDSVVDIVETAVHIEVQSGLPSRLGTAVVAGKVTELLDVSYYLGLAGGREAAAGTAKPAGQQRLLVVDDSAFFRNMLGPLLSAAGHAVVTVSSAEEALKLREEGAEFDLILSDIEMPGQSGLDFAEEIRADSRWRETPLVALSSLASAEHVARGAKAGFDQYVAKFDRQQLLAAVQNNLERHSA